MTWIYRRLLLTNRESIFFSGLVKIRDVNHGVFIPRFPSFLLFLCRCGLSLDSSGSRGGCRLVNLLVGNGWVCHPARKFYHGLYCTEAPDTSLIQLVSVVRARLRSIQTSLFSLSWKRITMHVWRSPSKTCWNESCTPCKFRSRGTHR